MIDLERRLGDAFHARADTVRPEDLTPALAPAPRARRVRRAVVAAVVAGAVAAGLAVALQQQGPSDRRTTAPAAPADPTTDPVERTRRLPEGQPIVPLPAGATASYDGGASATLDGSTLTLVRDGETWSADVSDRDRPALTEIRVDLGRHQGYVLGEGTASDPSFTVYVPAPGGRLVRVDWHEPITRIDPPGPKTGFAGWTIWIGTDGGLYGTLYRGTRVDDIALRWTLRGPVPSGVDEVELSGGTLARMCGSDRRTYCGG